VELKSFFLKILYHWTAALNLNLPSFHFFYFFACFLFIVGVSLVYLICPFCACSDIFILLT
jgi:hypothetical protein